jgi:hypothetical protein
VGVGPGPKSIAGGDGGSGDSPELCGLAAIAQYGVGQQDPETGFFEFYDVPEEVTAPSVSILDLLGEWPLLVPDFADAYQIRLHRETDMTWAEFWDLLRGLLSRDSRLQRRFAPELDPEEE